MGLLLGRQALQEHDVGHDGRARVLLECRVGQADRAEQLGLLGQHAARAGVDLVEQVARDDLHLQRARLQGVERGEEELVVDRMAVQLGLELEAQRLFAERRIADGQVERVIGQGNVLKAAVEHRFLRVEQRGDARGQIVVFDARKARLRGERVGDEADEVTGAHRRLERHAALIAQVTRRLPHGLHDGLRRVVRIERGTARLRIFLRPKQCHQFAAALGPCVLELGRFGRWECVGQAAPADIAGHDGLLGGRGAAVFALDRLHRHNGGDVVLVLGDLAAFAQVQGVGDAEVAGRDRDRGGRGLRGRQLCAGSGSRIIAW